MREENPSKVPAGYTLDLVGDPCVIVLRRGGGAIVARFTRNVDPQEIRRAAEEDSAEEQRSAFVHPGPEEDVLCDFHWWKVPRARGP